MKPLIRKKMNTRNDTSWLKDDVEITPEMKALGAIRQMKIHKKIKHVDEHELKHNMLNQRPPSPHVKEANWFHNIKRHSTINRNHKHKHDGSKTP